MKLSFDAVLRQRWPRDRSRAVRRRIEHLQAGEILMRGQQTVRMINAQPVDQSFGQEVTNQFVGGSKDARIFHAQAD